MRFYEETGIRLGLGIEDVPNPCLSPTSSHYESPVLGLLMRGSKQSPSSCFKFLSSPVVNLNLQAFCQSARPIRPASLMGHSLTSTIPINDNWNSGFVLLSLPYATPFSLRRLDCSNR